MSMVCPQCNQVFERQERVCPTCTIQLLFYARVGPAPTAASSASALEDNSQLWQHSSLGRVVVGVILAQGLALGLKQLFTAGFLASGDDLTTALWDTLAGLALLHGLHAVGLFAGGALAGAGQERGLLNGALVGLANGLLFLFMQPQSVQLLSEYAEYAHFAQPVLHLFVAAIAGGIGQVIWKPTPRLTVPEARKSSGTAPQIMEMRWLDGPIAWGRVSVGSIIVACGAIWSAMVMKWMIDNSQGTLSISTHFQARLVSWEIAGIVMLLGAAVAGFGTWNGMKQGLGVGIGGTVLYLGFEFANPKVPLETIVVTIMCMFVLGLIGGWFGGHLFPPLSRLPKKRRIMDL